MVYHMLKHLVISILFNYLNTTQFQNCHVIKHGFRTKSILSKLIFFQYLIHKTLHVQHDSLRIIFSVLDQNYSPHTRFENTLSLKFSPSSFTHTHFRNGTFHANAHGNNDGTLPKHIKNMLTQPRKIPPHSTICSMGGKIQGSGFGTSKHC